MGQRQGFLLVQRESGGVSVPSSGGSLRLAHRGSSRNKPFQPLRAERRMKRRDRGDYARVLFVLHTGLRMRLRIRRSARPHLEGGTNESFGRPRAVTTTGVMTHDPKKCEAVFGSGHAQTKGAHLQSASCLKIESRMRCDADDAISSMSWPGLSPPSTSCGP